MTKPANTALKYRIYPSGTAKKYLDTAIDIYRKCWNEFLAFYNQHQEDNEEAKHSDSFKAALAHVRQFRKEPDQEWAAHINSRYIDMMVQYALRPAFQKWFSALKDGSVKRSRAEYIERCKKTGKKINQKRLNSFYKPKFKSYRDRQTISFDPYGGAAIDFEKATFTIHKSAGPISLRIKKSDKVFLSDNLPKRYTVTRTKSGKYYLAVSMYNPYIEDVIESNDYPKKVGVNLGVRRLVMLSDGITIENPKFYNRSLKRLQRISRKLSRQLLENDHKLTKNAAKTKKRLAKAHERIANLRKDHTHRATDFLLKHYDLICIQKFDNKQMHKREVGESLGKGAFKKTGQSQKSKLTRSLLDANFFEFKRQLEYKAAQRGKKVIVVDSDFPATQLCSECGYLNEAINWRKTEWQCPECDATHDIDKNHAINVLQEGLR
jgi:putative transposase